jgi:hypothetical protein
MAMPYGPPPAMGRLVVHSSYTPLAFLFALTGVKVELNGHPSKVAWGQVPFDLPAGNYHLRVSARYMGEFGPAQLPVTVYPGQAVTVYYRTPAFIGMQGAIGFTPQPTRGMGASIALQVFLVAFIVLMVILTF